jgi:hypothetical protein
VFVFSTCRDCGGLLHTTADEHGTYNVVHPLCTPKPTKLERLEQEWLEAVELGQHTRELELHAELEEISNRPPRLLDAAIAYAAWGWPVFPLKPRSKIPVTKHGFKDATTNTDQIQGWWTNTEYNIGLPTGIAFDVIDIDVPDGIPAYQQLFSEDRSIHGHVATASGGQHLYIKPTGRGNHTRWLPGTDYRGQGGYVVAPPSRLDQPVRAWSWITHPSPCITGAGDTYGK